MRVQSPDRTEFEFQTFREDTFLVRGGRVRDDERLAAPPSPGALSSGDDAVALSEGCAASLAAAFAANFPREAPRVDEVPIERGVTFRNLA